VISLLDAIGTALEEHNGNIKVSLGAETKCFIHRAARRSRRKMVVDLRHPLPGEAFAR